MNTAQKDTVVSENLNQFDERIRNVNDLTTNQIKLNSHSQSSSVTVNRSFESVFLLDSSSDTDNSKHVVLRKTGNLSKLTGTMDNFDFAETRRKSKSEISLNEFLNSESNDVNNEKTDDLLAKALKIAIESKLQEVSALDSDQPEESPDNSSRSSSPHNSMMMSTPPPAGVVTDSDGLILPKKIINPCLESSDRKNLHRELMFNNKVGRSVLNQKSELQRAMEKQKERQLIMQQQQQQETKVEVGLKNELSRVIMERAQKIEKKNGSTHPESEPDSLNPEYLNARAKLRARIDTK